jgi:hypothetical protein
MKSKTMLALLFVVCLLALSACEFQAATTVNPDGSGELRTEVGFTAEERQNMEEQSGGSAQDFCNAQGSASPDVTVTEELRGDQTWCVTVSKFDDLDELSELYAEQEGITINRLEFEDEKFYYDVDVDTSSTESGFSAFSAITWTVTLPGAPVVHNASQVEGNTLTWDVTPQSGTVNLRAESETSAEQAGSSLLPLWLAGGGLAVLCLCIAVLAGGVGGFFLLRRARR